MVLHYLLYNDKHLFCVFITPNIVIFVQLLKEVVVSLIK